MFRLRQAGDVWYYTIDAFEETGLVRHCFSTRRGGVSQGEYESMNLRLNCGDAAENVRENFRRICGAVGIDSQQLVLSSQIHGDAIYVAKKEDRGDGIVRPNPRESADGLMTGEPGVPLATFYADCVPLFFLDPVKRVIALSHSGWKGTVRRIGAKTVEKMTAVYGSRPQDILAAVGPSIGVCHFEVGPEVADIFRREFGPETVREQGEKPHVNLQKAVALQLLAAGIQPGKLTVADICTYCNHDLLFSHRQTGGRRGSLGAFMELI